MGDEGHRYANLTLLPGDKRVFLTEKLFIDLHPNQQKWHFVALAVRETKSECDIRDGVLYRAFAHIDYKDPELDAMMTSIMQREYRGLDPCYNNQIIVLPTKCSRFERAHLQIQT